MGNNISYSSDDEFLRISMNLQKAELKKFLVLDLQANGFFIKTFEIAGLQLLLIKIKVTDLDKVNFKLISLPIYFSLLKLFSLKSFNESLKYLRTLSTPSKKIDFFGFGLESHSEKLSNFFADYEESFVFIKEKQIKHISKAINMLLALEEPFFYCFTESVPFTNLEKIPKSIEKSISHLV
jgi:hypothetical protein